MPHFNVYKHDQLTNKNKYHNAIFIVKIKKKLTYFKIQAFHAYEKRFSIAIEDTSLDTHVKV